MHYPDKSLPLSSFPSQPPAETPSPNLHSDHHSLCHTPPPHPSTPAPAYTALPYRDVDFYLAPLLNGRIGEIELETTDRKKFLVHKKVLESETVFFHIYYGFIPVWRLQSNGVGPPHPALPSHPPPPISPTPHTPSTSTSMSSVAVATGAINNLLCLPKFLVQLRNQPVSSTLPASSHSHAPSPSHPPSHSHRGDYGTESSLPLHDHQPGGGGGDGGAAPLDNETPPPVPPKDVMAPTPTNTPYTWVVPESSSVLTAFLTLIYPRGTFSAGPEDVLSSIDMTAKVIRAAMGYQSNKALNIARNRLSAFIPSSPVEIYSLACFFKFNDLAILASKAALAVPRVEWSHGNRAMMGKTGSAHLEVLRMTRLEGLKEILDRDMESDGHSASCVRREMIEQVWKRRATQVKEGLVPESELLELLEVDLRGGHCGDCLVLLGMTIQKALFAAKELPTSI